MAAVTTSLPGKDGFEILEYIGTSASDMPWYGPVSKARYIFGGSRRIGYVDKRDVEKMVALIDQGSKVFRVYQKPVEKKAEVKPEVEIAVSRGKAIKDFEPVIMPFDPADYSYRQLQKMVTELSATELSLLAESERANKNRVSVLSLFEVESA